MLNVHVHGIFCDYEYRCFGFYKGDFYYHIWDMIWIFFGHCFQHTLYKNCHKKTKSFYIHVSITQFTKALKAKRFVFRQVYSFWCVDNHFKTCQLLRWHQFCQTFLWPCYHSIFLWKFRVFYHIPKQSLMWTLVKKFHHMLWKPVTFHTLYRIQILKGVSNFPPYPSIKF